MLSVQGIAEFGLHTSAHSRQRSASIPVFRHNPRCGSFSELNTRPNWPLYADGDNVDISRVVPMPSHVARTTLGLRVDRVESRHSQNHTDIAIKKIVTSVSRQAMPPITQIPQELVDALIDAVASSYHSERLARAALRQCSLVSRSFRARCRMRLFQKVEFVDNYLPSRRVGAFLHLLEQPRSHLASCVKTLRLRDTFGEPDLPKTLSMLTNLRSLHLRVRPATAWTSLPPAFRNAIIRTLALESMEEVKLRGFADLPRTLTCRASRLQKLAIRDCTFADEDSPHFGVASLLPHPTFLSLRGPSSSFTHLIHASALSVSKVKEVKFDAASSEDVDCATTVLRLSSATLEKLTFVNPSSSILPELRLIDYPLLRHLHLEVQTDFQDCQCGLPVGLRLLLVEIPSTSMLHDISIKVRWDSCNMDVPWNRRALVEYWDEVDESLSRVSTLRTLCVTMTLSYCTLKDAWTQEDMMSLERASDDFDEILPHLLRRTSSRPNIDVRIVRNS